MRPGVGDAGPYGGVTHRGAYGRPRSAPPRRSCGNACAMEPATSKSNASIRRRVDFGRSKAAAPRKRSQHIRAGPPKGGAGSESSLIAGIVAKGVGTAIEALREAFINSGKDGQTGIDGDGRPRASATGDERLISKGCHLCGGGSADRHNGSRHEDTIACGVVGSGPQYAEWIVTQLAKRLPDEGAKT